MRSYLWLFAAILPGLSLADDSLEVKFHPAQVKIIEYEVSGKNAAELKAAMLNKGPRSRHGTRHFAQTSWFIRWSWPPGPDYSKAQVKTEIKFTLPKLKRPALISGWQEFYKNLTRHEEQHARHALNAAQEIKALLAELSRKVPRPPAEEANKAIDKIINKARAADFSYDKKTSHGLSEGVILR